MALQISLEINIDIKGEASLIEMLVDRLKRIGIEAINPLMPDGNKKVTFT